MPVSQRSRNLSDRVTLAGAKDGDRKYRARLRDLLANEDGPTQTVKEILRLGTERFGADHGHLARLDLVEGTRTVTKVSGAHPKVVQGDTTEIANTYCRAVLAKGEPLALENAPEQGWADDPAYQKFGMACYLGGKVVVHGEFYGTVCFVGELPRDEPFDEADRVFLDQITRSIAREVERERREEALRNAKGHADETESLLHRVREAPGVGGWEIHIGAWENFWTEDGRRMLGLMDEQPSLETLLDRIDPSMREHVKEAVQEAVERDEPFTVEVPITDDAEDRVRWVEIHGLPHVKNESAVRVIGTVQDITDRKQRMEQMEQSRWTSVYTQRIGEMARLLAEALGQPPEWQDKIREAAPLHDVGKVGIPNEILRKPGSLTDDEYEAMKEHTLIGEYLLTKGASETMKMAKEIARSHHERWDGSGYPDGLEREEIPLAARIVAVADVFNAMTHERPYRKALSVDRAFEVIEEEAGTQFDPQVSQAALDLREKLAALV